MVFSTISENVTKALSSSSLWGSILTCIVLIFVGFLLRKKDILKDGSEKVLTKIILKVVLPCLAFIGFMSDCSQASFMSAVFTFLFSLFFYLTSIPLSRLLTKFIKNDTKRKVVEILLIFGTTTLFGQPIIKSVFPDAMNDSNVFAIVFRIFLYTYAAISIENAGNKNDPENKSSPQMSKILKKIFLNPIIIATFLGVIMWGLQLIPGSNTSNWWTVLNGENYYVFWRLDIVAPWITNCISTIANLSGPLAYLAIGITLGGASFKKAMKDRDVWIFSIIKTFVFPILYCGVAIGLYYLFKQFGWVVLPTANSIDAITLMLAVPPSVVATSFCINYEKEKVFACNFSLVGNLMCIIALPFYVILLTILNSVIFAL